MRKNLPIVILLGVGICCNAVIYHDPENESVVIDDTIVLDPSKFIPAEEDAPTTLRPEGYCVTKTGGDGICIPLRECFPYAEYMMQEEAGVDSTISGFILEVVNSTELCSDESGYVCCPNYNYKALPAKRPTILPQFPIPTSTTPSTSTLTSVPTSTPGGVPTPTNQSTIVEKAKPSCGTFLKITDDNVVGGRYAEKGEFPWAVAMLLNGRQFCGGSLISSNYILTAAHCVQQMRNAAGMSVLVGGHNVGIQEPGRETRGVIKILYHRSFSMQHLQNDVALLQLSSPVSFNKYIQPICLNTAELTHTEKVDLAGWGKTGNYAGPSRILRTVNMALIPPTTCKRTYQGTNAPPLTQGMICAGERTPLKDACNGDSGGPLSLKTDDSAKQVGIVSWGIGCGEKPGVYTKVSAYLDWITKNSK